MVGQHPGGNSLTRSEPAGAARGVGLEQRCRRRRLPDRRRGTATAAKATTAPPTSSFGRGGRRLAHRRDGGAIRPARPRRPGRRRPRAANGGFGLGRSQGGRRANPAELPPVQQISTQQTGSTRHHGRPQVGRRRPISSIPSRCPASEDVRPDPQRFDAPGNSNAQSSDDQGLATPNLPRSWPSGVRIAAASSGGGGLTREERHRHEGPGDDAEGGVGRAEPGVPALLADDRGQGHGARTGARPSPARRARRELQRPAPPEERATAEGHQRRDRQPLGRAERVGARPGQRQHRRGVSASQPRFPARSLTIPRHLHQGRVDPERPRR